MVQILSRFDISVLSFSKGFSMTCSFFYCIHTVYMQFVSFFLKKHCFLCLTVVVAKIK